MSHSFVVFKLQTFPTFNPTKNEPKMHNIQNLISTMYIGSMSLLNSQALSVGLADNIE
jgi:hypothetical protein